MSGASFTDFFRDLHGCAAFPWQERLAIETIAKGRWPDVLDLPTGAGKTSAIDVALYALAQRPDVFPRRIVFVVDRRVVVDQAADHAREIRERMRRSTGAAADVAQLLRRTFAGGPDKEPFSVAVLRGGMPRDEGWAKYPDRPLVALSTVDQVGSRMLFRGYGVSPRMAPIHAGLLGNDTLLLLDEVQLSTAFAETLRAIGTRWMCWRKPEAPAALPSRWSFVRMSATPIGSDDDAQRFTIDDRDRSDHVLSKRLDGRKTASLQVIRVSGDPGRRQDEFARACATAAREHQKRGAKALAVIVNRVDTACRVFAELERLRREEVEVRLLTGRMRPLDRDRILGRRSDPASLVSRLTSRSRRGPDAKPVIVVSTQTLEAGADFDFDALVTECASIDALRQRFGRLDRRGDLGDARATILARQDQVADKLDDPIYGRALASTWKWLNAVASEGVVDFGFHHMPALPEDGDERQELCSPVVHAPVLLPAHLDAWTQTNPRPHPDPDVSLWLHGPDRGVPEIQVVWRADLPDLGKDDDLLEDTLAAQLEACPPSSAEALPVPLYAARAWLRRTRAEPFGDVEGEMEAPTDRDRDEQSDAPRPFVRYGHRKAQIARAPSELRPGDTIVVPSAYGGIAEGNWNPAASEPVRDLGDWAQLVQRARPVLRLVPEVLAGWFEQREEAVSPAPPVATDEDETAADLRDRVEEWLDNLDTAQAPQLEVVVRLLAARPRLIVLPDGHLTLLGRRKRIGIAMNVAEGDSSVLDLAGQAASDVITEDDDSSSFVGREVTLAEHLQDVRTIVRTFASNLGFPREVVEDVATAAWLHDVGKADPRFQKMLLGGSEIRASLQREVLAKSKGEARDRQAREQARSRAGYPRQYRHELLSVEMLSRADFTAHDRDLVLHLVGSHHGWCRPFAPAVDPGPPLQVELELEGMQLHADAAHSLARLDSGVTERFFDLVERYGWWGLAWLEAVMRLADHRASEMYESTRVESSRNLTCAT